MKIIVNSDDKKNEGDDGRIFYFFYLPQCNYILQVIIKVIEIVYWSMKFTWFGMIWCDVIRHDFGEHFLSSELHAVELSEQLILSKSKWHRMTLMLLKNLISTITSALTLTLTLTLKLLLYQLSIVSSLLNFSNQIYRFLLFWYYFCFYFWILFIILQIMI